MLLPSPVGPLFVEHDGEAVRRLWYWRQGEHPPAGTRDTPAPADRLGRRLTTELRDYFAGARCDFSVPVRPEGTAFQQQVWSALRDIPCGCTRTYAEVAARIGKPQAVRAIGQANRSNPIAILIPCHRVVAAGGRLGGYMGDWQAGEGADIKRWLLRHEGALSLEL